jgi:hypothetical protein
MEKVFLFEYATCGALEKLDPSICVEGLGMFKALLEKPVFTFVDKRIPYFNFPRTENYMEDFLRYVEDADFALVIAPEEDLNLYNFTKIVERAGCANLGSNSRAIFRASDKYETYKALREFMPKTELFRKSTTLDFPLVAKPRFGVSGKGIYLVNSEKELERVQKGYLVQEYVKGQAASASVMVGDETKIISVNTQEIENFRYKGAKIPFEIPEDEIIFKAVEKIKGLFGYVGVDFVLGEEIKIMEINPRPTTPIIAFKGVYGIDVLSLILKNYQGKIPEVRARKKVHLKKGRKTGKSFVHFKGYSIYLEYEDLNA